MTSKTETTTELTLVPAQLIQAVADARIAHQADVPVGTTVYWRHRAEKWTRRIASATAFGNPIEAANTVDFLSTYVFPDADIRLYPRSLGTNT